MPARVGPFWLRRSGSGRAVGGTALDPAALAGVVDRLDLPEAVWRTCPWQPRDLITTGLRQWLRCAGAALVEGQEIGMPSHAVDEAWHGLILCTARYAAFCDAAYGRMLHHHPEGGEPEGRSPRTGGDRLGRTVVAWSLVARPGEECVLWDLDARVGLEHPWGVPAAKVRAVLADLERIRAVHGRRG